jgi:hypothetical protein
MIKIAPDLTISAPAFGEIVAHYKFGKTLKDESTYNRQKFRNECGVTRAEEFLELVRHASEMQLEGLYMVRRETARDVAKWVKAHNFTQAKKDPVAAEQKEKKQKHATAVYIAEHMDLRDKLLLSLTNGMAKNPALAVMIADPAQHEVFVGRAVSIADKVMLDRMQHFRVSTEEDKKQEDFGKTIPPEVWDGTANG